MNLINPAKGIWDSYYSYTFYSSKPKYDKWFFVFTCSLSDVNLKLFGKSNRTFLGTQHVKKGKNTKLKGFLKIYTFEEVYKFSEKKPFEGLAPAILLNGQY